MKDTKEEEELDAEIDKRIGKAASTLARRTARVWTRPKRSTLPVLSAHCCMAAIHGLHMPGRRVG